MDTIVFISCCVVWFAGFWQLGKWLVYAVAWAINPKLRLFAHFDNKLRTVEDALDDLERTAKAIGLTMSVEVKPKRDLFTPSNN